MPWPKGKPHTREMIAKSVKSQTKWDWLPGHEIADRLLNTAATTRSIASEYGCSDSTIKKLFRKHTTKDQRIKVKCEKQGNTIRGRTLGRPRKPRNPQEVKARSAVNNAVRDGKLHRPDKCQHPGCQTNGRIEAHHWHGYDNEHLLDVVWLCAACHRFADSHPSLWVLVFRLVEEA